MKCYYCEKDMHWLTTDHIVPVSLNGNNLPKNKIKACHKCNSLKGPLMPAAFIEKIDRLLEETQFGHEFDRLKTIRKNTVKLDEYVKLNLIQLLK